MSTNRASLALEVAITQYLEVAITQYQDPAGVVRNSGSNVVLLPGASPVTGTRLTSTWPG